jgi:protein AroM
MSRVIGFVTIGQSPRTDMMEEFERALPDVRLAQRGALDDLGEDDISQLAPAAGDEVLVTRLRSRRQVRLAHRHAEPRLQVCLDRFADEGVGLAVVLCTGDFPHLTFPGVLLRPHRVLPHVVAALREGFAPSGSRPRLGVMVPDEAQIAAAKVRWSAYHAVPVAASPYGRLDAIEAAGDALGRAGVSLVVMDCIGYTRAMQQIIVRTAGVPAVFATGAVALVVRELAGVAAPAAGPARAYCAGAAPANSPTTFASTE